MELFLSCLPGLEPLLAAELAELAIGKDEPKVLPGGVTLRGDLETLYRANLESGLASHVLVRIGTFQAKSFPELIQRTARLPWKRYLAAGQAFDVRASCKKSRLYHTSAIEERIARGIIQRLKKTPELGTGQDEEGDEEQLPCIQVRIVNDICTLSFDSSGEALHRRGYRRCGLKAPLREDLARALILASGWQPEELLVDPFMGSGTIPIEAASLARKLAPGRLRSFAFEQTALMDQALWTKVKAVAAQKEQARAPAPIHGSDRDAGAVAAAARNAERAGVLDDLELANASLSDSAGLLAAREYRDGTAVVSNPPFGKRIRSGKGLLPLYQSFGRILSALPPSCKIAILAAERRLALATGIKLQTAFLSEHGGLKVRALVRVPVSLPTSEEIPRSKDQQ